MICLSKADESFFRHLTWNQSPSPLAATHTTRQDLNGISNLREHVDAEQDDGSGESSSLWQGNSDEKSHPSVQPPQSSQASFAGAGRLSPAMGMSSMLALTVMCAYNSRTVLASADGQWR